MCLTCYVSLNLGNNSFKGKLKIGIVYPEKEYICQGGLLVVKWAQIHTQRLAAIADGGLSHVLHLRAELPSLLLPFLCRFYTLLHAIYVACLFIICFPHCDLGSRGSWVIASSV